MCAPGGETGPVSGEGVGGVTALQSDLGGWLKRHRLAAGLSHEELAEAAGLSARGMSDLERGVGRRGEVPDAPSLRDRGGGKGWSQVHRGVGSPPYRCRGRPTKTIERIEPPHRQAAARILERRYPREYGRSVGDRNRNCRTASGEDPVKVTSDA